MFALILGISIFAMGSPLIRTIGKENVYSARITIENRDTSVNACDSICPRYWFIKFKDHHNYSDFYDYRITVCKKASESGLMTIFSSTVQWYTAHDTLPCNSLGFLPEYNRIDTLKTDTTVIYWSYPRLTKRLAGPNMQLPLSFSNHLKILLRSKSVIDSIVFTRQKVVFAKVLQPVTSDNKTQAMKKADKTNAIRTAIYDIRGRQFLPGRGSHVAFAALSPNGALTLQKVLFVGSQFYK